MESRKSKGQLKKYHDAIQEANSCDEEVIKYTLDQAGLFSKQQIFPLASLQFELTSHCNAFCRHCYNNSGVQNHVLDPMTPEKWISFAEYLVRHGGVFECLLSGGEPLLLGEQLFRIMDILHDDGTLFLLQTNGTLLTEDIARKLKKYKYHWLQISIDGVTAEYHDAFRRMKGCWEKAVRAARVSVKHNIPLKIAHCVTPKNLMEIDDMCDFAYSLGASAITVGELSLSGRTAEHQELLLSSEQRKFLYQMVEENIVRYSGRMRIRSSNPVRYGLNRQRQSPYSAALIRPNGDIRIDGMAPFVIGNILRDDFSEVWSKKIELSWKDQRVIDFISNFDCEDRNYKTINFYNEDIYI